MLVSRQFFDCAEGYGGAGASERVLGECLQKGMERGLWERMDLVVSTKLFGGGRANRDTINSIGLSRKHLYEGMVASLKRLQLDYVDLVSHGADSRWPVHLVSLQLAANDHNLFVLGVLPSAGPPYSDRGNSARDEQPHRSRPGFLLGN